MSNFFASKLLHLQLLQLAFKALRLNKKIFKVNRKASSKKKLHACKNGLQNQLKEGIWWGRKQAKVETRYYNNYYNTKKGSIICLHLYFKGGLVRIGQMGIEIVSRVSTVEYMRICMSMGYVYNG